MTILPRTLKFAASLMLLFVLGACGSGDGSLDPEVEASLREITDRYQAQYGIPGILVGVWIPNEGQLILEDGISDLATDAPIRQDQHFRIGSVTKSFTVTLLFQLAEEGALSLDDPLETYVPGLQNGSATLGQLAAMTSGIFNYTEDEDFVLGFIESNFLRQYPTQELIDFANANAPYFPSGQGWHYSNTNTVLLGLVAEQVTGRPLADLIQERILDRLDLRGSSYPSTPDMPSPFVHGYGFDPLEDISLTDPSSSQGSGAMISTLPDLKKWAEALGTGALLSAASQNTRIQSLQPITFSPCQDDDPNRPKRDCPDYDRYGMGIGEIQGWIGHTGEYVGYTVLVMYRPGDAAVTVILVNLFGVGEHVPTSMFREFAEILNP